MEGQVTITKKEYLRLTVAYEELSRLNGGGVDNWEWYVESLNPKGEINIDTFEQNERERILNL